MVRTKNLAAGLFVVGMGIVLGVVAIAAPLQNSDCLPTGKWECLKQGYRLCNYKGTACASNTCYQCNKGPSSLPAKMCFIVEGKTCTPGATKVICALLYSDAKCVVEEDTNACICEAVAPPDKGKKCTFTNCN